MKTDYGIDAPKIVRNLFLFSFILVAVSLLSIRINNTIWFWIIFLYTFSISIMLFITNCWMPYGIKVSKPKIIQTIISNLNLKDNEKTLDLGCGRGLLLCKIAKHLSKGEAHGIDLWSNKDQSGNSPERTLHNAEQEKVRNRITIHTGNICSLLFLDNPFDIVVSSLFP